MKDNLTNHILNKLVGMGFIEAKVYLERKLPKHQLRLVREDATHFAVTDDLVMNRHDVEVDNVKITKIN